MSAVPDSPPSWLDLLRPARTPILQPIVPGSKSAAWFVEVQFERYDSGDTAKPSWNVTYGKTQIVGDDGAWSVAEIELVRRMRGGGWSCGWIDGFGSAPKAWAQWLVNPGELRTPLRRASNAITRETGLPRGGAPDVIAWRGDGLDSAVFIEYKGPNDRIRQGQDAWLTSALAAGLTANQFTVAKWPKAKKR